MLESPGESGEEPPPLELGAGHSRYPNLRGAPPGLPAGAPLVMQPYEENTIMDQVKEKWMGSAILTKKVINTSKKKVEQMYLRDKICLNQKDKGAVAHWLR